MPRLYDVEWYNGRPFKYEEGFLSNRAAFLVGMPRMRQLRVKPGVYKKKIVLEFLKENVYDRIINYSE